MGGSGEALNAVSLFAGFQHHAQGHVRVGRLRRRVLELAAPIYLPHNIIFIDAEESEVGARLAEAGVYACAVHRVEGRIYDH